MEPRKIELAHKPGVALVLSVYFPTPAASGPFVTTLVVFLNGLVLPRASWLPAAAQLLALRPDTIPTLLCYDRYGQGDSEPDPADGPNGHDACVAANDLHALLESVSRADLGTDIARLRLVFVGNSIGCALARLYAAAYPGRVEAFLFLDPMMANSDQVSLLPDPDVPGTHQAPLVKADELRHARAAFRAVFHPSVPNSERLDRSNLPQLLPSAESPILPVGPDSRPPLLVVIGHDWDEFAEQNEKGQLKISQSVTQAYLNPAWAEYNAGLARLADGGEVKIARGCGHFIQRDDPGFVAAELNQLLNEMLQRRIF